MVKWILPLLRNLEKHASSAWYPFVLGFITFVDHFLFVVPMLALMITSVFIAPKRWFPIALFMSIGGAVGAGVFAAVIEKFGLSFILWIAPHMPEHAIWKTAEQWFQNYGLWALFGNSLLPLTDHPMLALAGLSKIHISQIIAASGAGKGIKYFAFSWIASHSPKLLNRFKKVEREIEKSKLTISVDALDRESKD